MTVATPLTEMEYHILNDFQDGFPLEPRPYERMGAALGIEEDEVLGVLRDLRARGMVSRVGPVIKPHTVGASTLAAMQVPPDRLDAVAALVSARPEVNHNYERAHAINLWFVVTAADQHGVAVVLADIEAETGITVLDLPLVHAFHIDLGFQLKC